MDCREATGQGLFEGGFGYLVCHSWLVEAAMFDSALNLDARSVRWVWLWVSQLIRLWSAEVLSHASKSDVTRQLQLP